MTTDHEMERIVRSWLEPGMTTLTDDVLDAVMDQLPATPQRRPIWSLGRIQHVNPFAKFSLAAAALVVVAVVGYNLVAPGGQPDVGGSLPSPSPSPASTPAAGLPEGPFVLRHFGAGRPITVTIPAPGWFGEPGNGILIKNDTGDAPIGAGMIVFAEDLYVYGDPCRWSTTTPETPATTVDELVAALSAQSLRDASAPVDITVDGYTGTSITLHVPDDAVFSECDQGFFGSWGTLSEPTPARYHQDPGQIDELWILDVNGELVVIDTAYYEATPTEHVVETRAIVQSATFGE